ncbi:dachshund homolog 2-like isoform X2 [Procambarus clarkii]|uniref:dachshund homolog 2-like isoform X2 n=1 Tax=Procambarus clarkii TaxID=6728 RepID=UPI003742E4CF
MEDSSIPDDCRSVRSGGSANGRSPPPLSPVITSMVNCVSPSSPPPPLMAAPPLSVPGPSPPGGHSPPIFPSPPPTSRPPPFLPALYFSHAYNSPPPIHTSDPTANDCKLVEYRGQKVAAFIINNESMLCLPQAFELFLKNLVGGLHTVYTKLKRLGIEPLVCNVEQVRVLRGLGAIQPGVNRCKLLAVKHFDILYKDCTTARSGSRPRLVVGPLPPHGGALPPHGGPLPPHGGPNPGAHPTLPSIAIPGRPPKRPHEILGMGGLPGHLGPGGLPPPHLSPEALMALKKTRMDARDFPPFMNGGVPDNEMEKSPLLSNGYNQPPKGLMAQYMALNGGMPHPALLAHTGLPLPPHPAPWATHAADHPFKSGPPPDSLARSMVWENCRASYDEVLKHLERIREDRNRADRVLGLERDEAPDRPISPHKTNEKHHLYMQHSPVWLDSTHTHPAGYGEGDALNLSSKSDSRDDLSDAPTPRDDRDDKDDGLSDADDLDDKNDLSDRDDFDYPDRPSLHYNNNNLTSTTNNNSSSGGGVGGLGAGMSTLLSGTISSSSSSSSSVPTPTTSQSSALLPVADDRLPPGLSGLAGLSMGGPDATPPTPHHPPLSSLENLLGNIQNLLKVAAESVRHEEKQWIREKEHLQLEFQRQKEMRERLEKQLVEDEKVKLLYLRKLKKEKRARRRLEEELTEKLKRLSQYEPNAKELLRAAAESLAKEGVNNAAVAAAAAAAAAAASGGSSGQSDNPHHSPKTHQSQQQQQQQQQQDLQDVRTSQSEGPPVYFNKSMLFNCTA